ncbi:MAG: hypothetical protein P1V20_29195 [Verrucomicrobiales bacterium]|nr:hypothetical protein [Verrucomicrobiales bacterium]
MKLISFYLLILILWSPVLLHAQAGYVKIINLIDTGEPTTLSINGYTFKRGNPMPVGFTTGAFSLNPGPHTIGINNPGAEKPDMNIAVTLVPGGTYGVICFSELEMSEDEEGNPVEIFKLKHAVLHGQDEIGKPRFTLFSLSKNEVVEVRVKGRPYRVSPKRPVKIDVSLEEIVVIKDMQGKNVGEVEIISPYHYVGFINDRLGGKGMRLTAYAQRGFSGGELTVTEGDTPENEEANNEDKAPAEAAAEPAVAEE